MGNCDAGRRRILDAGGCRILDVRTRRTLYWRPVERSVPRFRRRGRSGRRRRGRHRRFGCLDASFVEDGLAVPCLAVVLRERVVSRRPIEVRGRLFRPRGQRTFRRGVGHLSCCLAVNRLSKVALIVEFRPSLNLKPVTRNRLVTPLPVGSNRRRDRAPWRRLKSAPEMTKPAALPLVPHRSRQLAY